MKKTITFLIIGIIIGALVSCTPPKTKQDETKEINATADTCINPTQLKTCENTLKEKEAALQKLEQKNFELTKLSSKELTTFSNKEAGLSFSYPAWFGEIDFEIRNGSDSGELFKGVFKNVQIEFGGVTKNFGEGRGATFTDFAGYTATGNKYYYNLWEEEIEYEVTKTIQVQGGKILLLKGKGESMPGNNLPEGTFGAIANLKGEKFHGVSFIASDEEKRISSDEFESMLKTIVIQ